MLFYWEVMPKYSTFSVNIETKSLVKINKVAPHISIVNGLIYAEFYQIT